MPPGPSNSMRIYALPLSRAQLNHPALVYYLASLPPKQKNRPDSRTAALAKRGLQKLTETWNRWGNLESGWQRRVYNFGQRAQARINFEELALRSIDPALGPKIMSTGQGVKMLDNLSHTQDKLNSSHRIPLLYPSIFKTSVEDEPLAHLEKHVSHHEPKHRRNFWIYLAATPFTAPFMLVPVIPNIPFFFAAWRAWSNYKAYKASGYLGSLIKAGAISPQVDSILDEQYQLSAASTLRTTSMPSSSPASSHSSSSSTHTHADRSLAGVDVKPDSISSSASPGTSESDVLLHERTAPGLVAALGLPVETATELIHAIRQVRTRLGLVTKPASARN